MGLKVLLVTFPVLLATYACSTINYTEPQTGDLSRVRFASYESKPVVIRAYETKDCKGEREWMTLRNGTLINSNPKSLGIPLGNFNKNAFKEFNVQVGSEKVIMFVGSSAVGNSVFTCGVPLSLSFLEKNKDYELLFQMGLNSCFVVSSEIIKEPSGQFKKNKIKAYSNKNQEGFGEECIKQFHKFRLF